MEKADTHHHKFQSWALLWNTCRASVLQSVYKHLPEAVDVASLVECLPSIEEGPRFDHIT